MGHPSFRMIEKNPSGTDAAVIAQVAANDGSAIWKRLMALKLKGFLIGASCIGRADKKQKEMGLQAPHAYAVLDVREIPSQHLRLCKLRNPWGIQSWKGDWSKTSSMWNDFPDVKTLLKPETEDDGVFWLNWQDLRDYFASCEICRVRSEDWSEIREKGFWLPSAVGLGNAVEFSCFIDTEVDITIRQESPELREDSQSHMMDLGFGILRKDDKGDSYTLVDDTPRMLKSQSSKEFKLKEGTYIMIPLCFNHLQIPAPRKFVFDTHSSQPLIIEKRDMQARWLSEVMIQRAIRHGKRQEVVPLAQGGPINFYAHHGNEECGVTLVVENMAQSPGTCLNIEIEFEESQTTNMVSSRGTYYTQDLIPCATRALVQVLSPRQGQSGFGWSMRPAMQIEHGSVESHIPEFDPLSRIDEIHKAVPVSTQQPDWVKNFNFNTIGRKPVGESEF